VRHITALFWLPAGARRLARQFGGNSTQVFFLTWFPTYLVTARA